MTRLRNDVYCDYYRNQALQRGGGMPYFAGARYQRGHGLGNVFRGIFSGLRSIFPSLLKTAGRHALTTGVNIASDMLDGKKFKDVAGTHAMHGLKSAARDVAPDVVKAIKRPFD